MLLDVVAERFIVFLNMSCLDVVCRVSWTNDFCGLKDTCSSCILVARKSSQKDMYVVASLGHGFLLC